MSKFPLKHFFNHTRANCFIFPSLIEFKSEIAKDIKYKKYLSCSTNKKELCEYCTLIINLYYIFYIQGVT